MMSVCSHELPSTVSPYGEEEKRQLGYRVEGSGYDDITSLLSCPVHQRSYADPDSESAKIYSL